MLTLRSARSIHSKDRSARQRKRAKRAVYQAIDREYFGYGQPTNPTDFIDNDVHKVVINPGVAYVSTSLNEIFEKRNARNLAKSLKAKNQFVTMRVDAKDANVGQSRYSDNADEDVVVTTAYEPYQLKTVSKVSPVEEVDWNEAEEDALILAHQPFETVMQTGYKDYLNHLGTKFIARRSDIIVSSTLSITLAPEDDKVVPAYFSRLTAEGIKTYVDGRSRYRALSVASNTLPQKRGEADSSVERIAIESESESEGEAEGFEEFKAKQAEQEQAEHARRTTVKAGIQESRFQLPRTLLTAPLNPARVARLRGKDKKLYNLQKSKHEVTMKAVAKRPVHPSKQTFSLDDAKTLVNGNYYLEEEKDDEPIQGMQGLSPNPTAQLGRAMVSA